MASRLQPAARYTGRVLLAALGSLALFGVMYAVWGLVVAPWIRLRASGPVVLALAALSVYGWIYLRLRWLKHRPVRPRSSVRRGRHKPESGLPAEK